LRDLIGKRIMADDAEDLLAYDMLTEIDLVA
jgi:hypothetical protein